MTAPLISIVIPVFNGLRFLPEAVHSVLNQTHEQIELVLVDGGSKDGSREWITTFAAEHPCTTDFLPSGTPAARTWTRASELATGEYLTLLCQDDVLYPHAMASQLASLTNVPEAAMVSARRNIIDGTGKIVASSRGGQGVTAGIHPGQELLRTAYTKATNIFGEPLAVLFRRAALTEHLPWNDSNPFMLDMEMYARVLSKATAVVNPDTIGAFRVSTSSWSTSLAASQTQQFAHWQEVTAQHLIPQPSSKERSAASRNRKIQAALRRAAYAWLRLRSRM